MAAEISRWKFDNDYLDANTTNANDLSAGGSGNSFGATIKQVGTYSLKFNGSGYATRTATINGVSAITGNQDNSYGGWIYFQSGESSLMMWGTNAVSQGYEIRIISATSIRVSLQGEDKNITVTSMATNTWHWVWVEYTASTKTFELYLNNVSQNTAVLTATPNIAFGKINVGADFNDLSNPPNNTQYDDMRLWSGVTAAGDRTAIFNAGSESILDLTSKIW